MTIHTRRPYMFHEELHSKVDSLGSKAAWVCIMLLAEGVEPFTDQLKGIKRPAGFETLLDAGIIRSAGRPESYEFNPAWVRRGDYDTVMQAAELAVAVYDDPHASPAALQRAMDTLRTLLADRGS